MKKYQIRLKDGKYQLVSPQDRVIIQSKNKKDIVEYAKQSDVEFTETTEKKKRKARKSLSTTNRL